jgi:2-dehydropantoate 2-reductase
MNPRSYAIIGTGALGGFYGARLQRAGLDVHFLVHSDYEHVRGHGLVCESKDGDFSLPHVQAYCTTGDMPRCDVVLVALKATQNHLLKELLPPVVKDDGVVLLMQNGLGGEALIADIVGPQRVMGGLSFLCSNKAGPGRIRHLDYGQVSLGEFARPGVSKRMQAIAEDLTKAGVPVQLLEDLRVARWNKLVWNIPYNGLSVILNATTAELMKNAAIRQLCEALMREIVADARACGVPVKDEIVGKMIEHTDKMTPYRTSMKVDFDERRPMEVEAIFGNPLRAAQQAGLPSPLLETIYRQLVFLNSR